MKKIFISFLLSVLMISNFSGVQALEIISNDNKVDVIQNEQKDDIFAFAEEVTIKSLVEEDFLSLAGQIFIEAELQKDFIFAGGEVRIDDKINDDVRGVAGVIEINSDILGDVIVAAGELKLKKDVVIHGDLIALAADTDLQGTVKGKVILATDVLELGGILESNVELYVDRLLESSDIGKIQGNLKYTSDNEQKLLESLVQGEITSHVLGYKEDLNEQVSEFFIFAVLFKTIFIVGASLLLFFLLQNLFRKVANNITDQTGKSFLLGFLYIILTPILIILLFISFIGFPLAIILLFAYILTFCMLNILNTVVITGLVVNKYPKTDNIYIKILIIVLLGSILSIVNFLGVIIGCFTLGGLFILKKQVIELMNK